MKYFLSFVAVLAAILLFLRFVPSAPINPILPIGPQQDVHGHGADVHPGPATPGGPAEMNEEEAEEERGSGAAIPAARPGQTYGAVITPVGAISMSELGKLLGTKDSVQVKLVAEASSVCKVKGCWMTLPTADGKEMRVSFKDYGFFVPADMEGRTVVVSGWAHREVVPVAYLQHYAKDAGKSAKEIAAITQDEQQLNFEADGVLVQN